MAVLCCGLTVICKQSWLFAVRRLMDYYCITCSLILLTTRRPCSAVTGKQCDAAAYVMQSVQAVVTCVLFDTFSGRDMSVLMSKKVCHKKPRISLRGHSSLSWSYILAAIDAFYIIIYCKTQNFRMPFISRILRPRQIRQKITGREYLTGRPNLAY